MTRQELIKICEDAIVPQGLWKNRDSAHSQEGVGKCLVFLKAGCEFQIQTKENSHKDSSCITDERTIWIQFYVRDFSWFEGGSEDDLRGSDSLDYHFYLPTRKRLQEVNGHDWY